MSTRAEFFQSMYPGLSDGEVIDEHGRIERSFQGIFGIGAG